MTAFIIVTVIVIFVIILIKSSTSSEEPIDFESKQKQFIQSYQEPRLPKEAQEMYEILKAQNLKGEGTDLDTIPDGYGEFGFEATNPIPTNTIYGSRLYLTKLRTMDGKKVENRRLGSFVAPNIPNMIDKYEISVEGNLIGCIYISPYNKKNSERAPIGLEVSPIPFL